ncbi:MAG: hypothetical protein ACLSVD_04055 [Eggerthellaceae bacterium]
MSTDLRKKTLIGGVACSLALALACALPGGTAWATYLPEGSGQFDVSVITDVLPTADPEARLSDVAIHVANEAGQHVEAAQVEIVVVPPNASQSGADAAEGASHAISAKGSTSGDGRVLPNAAVGAVPGDGGQSGLRIEGGSRARVERRNLGSGVNASTRWPPALRRQRAERGRGGRRRGGLSSARPDGGFPGRAFVSAGQAFTADNRAGACGGLPVAVERIRKRAATMKHKREDAPTRIA